MTTNKEYTEIVGLDHRKKFAQFFTPEIISDFMVKWILSNTSEDTTILDPAFGLGIFCNSIKKINQDIKVIGYDIDEAIYNIAIKDFDPFKESVSIINQDYLKSSWSKMYDGIICNPPYLKFHDYNSTYYIPEVNSHLGTQLNGFTNIYSLFLLKSISQLKKGGRLAYIIPSEFLNSDYGVEVKKYLIKSKVLKHIIIIDFTECPFDDALTTASILFCENNGKEEDIRFSTIKKVSELNTCLEVYKSYAPSELNITEKWKQYYETTSSQNYHHLVPFNKFAKVSRGIASGANNYFSFNQSKIIEYNLKINSFLPCICHSQDVKGQIFTLNDFKLLKEENKFVYLFNGSADEKNISTKNYIKYGESLGIDKRYLTSCRTPWYALEKREPSPIWVSVFNRNGLRFVRNEAKAYNLTTFHCVYVKDMIEIDVLFAYLLTSVAQQIFLDNSRQYGNGLVKFEPNDLNKGKVVDLTLLTGSEIIYIKTIYYLLKNNFEKSSYYINLLDSFFKAKYTDNPYDIDELLLELDE